MRIGIDFDNTIICYDEVFCHLAKAENLVPHDFTGSKNDVREAVWASSEGDIGWQRLQGKAYGEYLHLARMFNGFREFIAACNEHPQIQVYIVSHKTEFGHFDDKRINLRDAARAWLRAQGFFNGNIPSIPEENCFFEGTREEKIDRIKQLSCTHFIDDLPEVLQAEGFPAHTKRFLFQPEGTEKNSFANWVDIKDAIFSK